MIERLRFFASEYDRFLMTEHYFLDLYHRKQHNMITNATIYYDRANEEYLSNKRITNLPVGGWPIVTPKGERTILYPELMEMRGHNWYRMEASIGLIYPRSNKHTRRILRGALWTFLNHYDSSVEPPQYQGKHFRQHPYTYELAFPMYIEKSTTPWGPAHIRKGCLSTPPPKRPSRWRFVKRFILFTARVILRLVKITIILHVLYIVIALYCWFYVTWFM